MLVAALPLVTHALMAQGPATPDSSAAPAVLRRESWTSDRRAVRVGDLLTVVVGEYVDARERTREVARSNRRQAASLSGEPIPSALGEIGVGYGAQSDNTGDAGRTGNLDAVLTVRVTQVEPSGVVRIEGTRRVSIDGRRQEIVLSGVVRPEDISSNNIVASNRIADAEILYKGKKIGPRTGLFGKLLAALWP
jgi:flagellar L-ring protein precursor FlgH